MSESEVFVTVPKRAGILPRVGADETVVMDDAEAAVVTLVKLKAMGVQVDESFDQVPSLFI